MRTVITRALGALRSQRFGILAGMTTAAALGVGSFIMDAWPEAYRGLEMDDLRFFFEPLRAVHWWFYLLGVALALWGLSALLCTWDSVSARVRHKIWRPSAYGAPVLHVAFLLTLVAHLWGGLSERSERWVIGPGPTRIAGVTYRPLTIDVDAYPTGMPRGVTITLERSRGERTDEVTIGYNEPLVSEGGVRTLLLGRYAYSAAAVIDLHGERYVLGEGEGAGAGPSRLQVHKVYVGKSLRAPMVDVTIGERRQWLTLGAPDPEQPGVSFVDIERRPVLSVTERVNPSTPLVSLIALLALLGVALIAAEHRWRRRRHLSES